MATITRFEELECWQTARLLTREVYRLTMRGHFTKDFALRDQMRRASVSVMSNIAEGFESRTRPLFVELLGRAKGSAGELRAQLYVAFDADYITKDDFDRLRNLAEKISSQISRLSTYLKSAPDADSVREDFPAYDIPTF